MRRVTLTVIGLTACACGAQASHIQLTTLGATGRTAGIRTDSATPLEQGRWSIGIGADYSGSDQLSEQELLDARAEDSEASLHSLDSITTLILDATYGLTPDITVGLYLPYVTRSDIMEAAEDGEEIEHLGDSSGIGDATVFGLWRFYEDKASDTSLGLIAGLKLPTGVDDNVADVGETFEMEFQPGSGSWDPFAGLAWSRGVGGFNMAASTIYTWGMEGTANTDLGDRWTYNLGAGHALGGAGGAAWNAVLELNGGWRDREQTDGVTGTNSGGSWLYVSPGLTVSGQNWTAYASWSYPVDNSLNGVQDDLGSRFLVGVQFQR